jgi:hypothetical protein
VNNISRDKARAADPGKDYENLTIEANPQVMKNNNPKRITSPGKEQQNYMQMNNVSKARTVGPLGKDHEKALVKNF